MHEPAMNARFRGQSGLDPVYGISAREEITFASLPGTKCIGVLTFAIRSFGANQHFTSINERVKNVVKPSRCRAMRGQEGSNRIVHTWLLRGELCRAEIALLPGEAEHNRVGADRV